MSSAEIWIGDPGVWSPAEAAKRAASKLTPPRRSTRATSAPDVPRPEDVGQSQTDRRGGLNPKAMCGTVCTLCVIGPGAPVRCDKPVNHEGDHCCTLGLLFNQTVSESAEITWRSFDWEKKYDITVGHGAAGTAVVRDYIEGSIQLFRTNGDGDSLAQRIAKAVTHEGLAEECEVEFERATPALSRRNKEQT